MRKIFIDGGAHKGESVDLFFKLFQDADEYSVHSFEPNPDMWDLLEKKKTILHKNGLWNKDGIREYFKGRSTEGGTFLTKKVSGKVDYNHPFPVHCIRLSRWIQDNFDKEDYIVLKLDVEGAEYAILEDMIDSGVMSWIDEFYGELHGTGPTGRIRSLDSHVYYDMEKKLKLHGVEMKHWGDNDGSRF